MPKSVASYVSVARSNSSEDEDILGREAEASINAQWNAFHSQSAPPSQTSDADSRNRRFPADEHSGLLSHTESLSNTYRTIPTSSPTTPKRGFSRQHSYTHTLRSRNTSRRNSTSRKHSRPFGVDSVSSEPSNLATPLRSVLFDNRTWYDQFTSTDWIRDAIADAERVKELRSRKDWRGRLQALFDGAQGWILVAIIGCITAGIAYIIDVTEAAVFDFKTGYCTTRWYYSKRRCCDGANICDNWTRWSALHHGEDDSKRLVDFVAFVGWVVCLALLACLVTLGTRTTIAPHIKLPTMDENLAADPDHRRSRKDDEGTASPSRQLTHLARNGPMTYYPAAGSGVAEVKVILSGFVLHGYLGVRTLIFKSIGLILSVASGLSLGKEGPYVHIATCVGNVACRLFSKYRHNDAKRREVLSASAAAGVAVAFGAPIGGVLFSLEEVSYYFPPKTLFRTFFCCIVAALSLKFLNPYGTNKIVLFEVRYLTDWRLFEIVIFALLGMLGGAAGAFFIKASRFWATHFRRSSWIKNSPILEVLLVAVVTGLVSFWNKYTRLPVAELLYGLAAPCDSFSDTGYGLCPSEERIPSVIGYLTWAFVVKAILTIITFGIKMPAGIYVPSMVVGGLLGRIVGHTMQLATLRNPGFADLVGCSANGNPEECIVPGVYALVAAGATMCGVTRLSVTLAVILFELTGSLEHVLPFSLGVLIAKWTADALEPLSIYDLLTDMNAYPFLDSKIRPVFTTELGDITPATHRDTCIDISASPWVRATQLRKKLDHLHMAGELDGGFPIICEGVLVGLIPAPDLEFALDRLKDEDEVYCLMNPHEKTSGASAYYQNFRQVPTQTDDAVEDDNSIADEAASERPRDGSDTSDFTCYIDPAPMSLDICSPMDLVFECFVKLGLRYICVLTEGKFAGLVHKKVFVKYVKDLQHTGNVG